MDGSSLSPLVAAIAVGVAGYVRGYGGVGFAMITVAALSLLFPPARGVPMGLLTTAILWINEFPDAEGDALAGKNHLVVTLGKSAARYGYAMLVGGAFGMLFFMVMAGYWPKAVLLGLLALPMAVRATKQLFVDFDSRDLVQACAGTIRYNLLTGVLMAVGLLLAAW